MIIYVTWMVGKSREETMKTRYIVSLFLLVLLTACSPNDFEGGTYKPMQEDFDKRRLDSILIMSNYMEEYKVKVGHYPFHKDDPDQLPVGVIIQSAMQKDTHGGKVRFFIDLNTRAVDGKVPPKPEGIDVQEVQELVEELERGLGRAVRLSTDPQKVPVNKPSVFIYIYYKGVFDITAFIHNEFAFARPLGPFNNKITVGTRSNPSMGIWTPRDLIAQEDFKRFMQSPFNKGGYTLKYDYGYE